MSTYTTNKEYQQDLTVKNNKFKVFSLRKCAEKLKFDLKKLPYSLRILLENSLRYGASDKDLSHFAKWNGSPDSDSELDFIPARVLMQDFTGVPAIVDLAAMRDAVQKAGGDPKKINPLIPVDLVIDHSVQVDFAGSADSLKRNTQLEFDRNHERYQFLKWGQQAFDNFKVVPPGTGICHQVNLENLAQVVWSNNQNGENYAYPDTLVGTDSHTTMINGLGVLGWGVGGIEAEAAMLGQPLPMVIPQVIGFKLTGCVNEGITATDLVLTVTEMLRKKGVVGKLVEFFGSGLEALSLADRATIANMAPEYGATCGFFPVDDETVNYLELTNRSNDRIDLVKAYCKEQHLWRDDSDEIIYTDVLELDLSKVVPCLAGPKRPQDRVELNKVRDSFATELSSFEADKSKHNVRFKAKNNDLSASHGDVVIAAITSCTNTSNPSVMIAAGLVAQNAVKVGLTKKPWVKASLTPGSQVVSEYLKINKLDNDLDSLGFNVVGFGCATCIGNSGPLDKDIETLIADNKLMVASVLSGNRNFEGRVHPSVRANYLASPPLVVAYAIAGTVNIDLMSEPIGKSKDGKDVYLSDIWPTKEQIDLCIKNSITRELFSDKYSNVFSGDENWKNIEAASSSNYNWDKNSSYINNPPYFRDLTSSLNSLKNIEQANILAVLGDSVTTDHISPAGNIAKTSPAAVYLNSRGVEAADFNSYGARRGNHEVMMRGTFANTRIKNKLCPGVEGGFTTHYPSKEVLPIFDAAMKYQENKTPLVIFAGKEYGTGSSRDWAAKGTCLLGVKAVIAESFERIHRSNLVGMGVLPLEFCDGMTAEKLNLKGDEVVSIKGISDALTPREMLTCEISVNGTVKHSFKVRALVQTEVEVSYIKNGSILHKVVRQLS